MSAGCDKIAAAKPCACGKEKLGQLCLRGFPGRLLVRQRRKRCTQDTHSRDTATERDARLRRSRELSPPFGRDALVDLLVRELVDQELTDSVCSI